MTANKGFGSGSSKLKPTLNMAIRLNEVGKLIDLGKLDLALRELSAVAGAQSKRAPFFNSIGLGFVQRGDSFNALEAFRKAVEDHPLNCEYLYNCSVAAFDLDLRDESIGMLEKLIALCPKIADAHFNLGNIFRQDRNLEKAKDCYESALDLQPNSSKFLYNYALTLQDMMLAEEALTFYKKLLLLEPEHSVALSNIGNLYTLLGELGLATKYLEEAISIDPGSHIAHYNMGNALRLLRLVPESILSYRNALEINAEDPDYHWNLANSLLLNGDYCEGLEKYEYRWQGIKNPPKFCSDLLTSPELLWDGANHSDGDEILLICEQGLGDALQFLRYGKYLKNAGLKIGIVAPKKLHDLIRVSGLSHCVYCSYDVVKDFKWISIMSLPRVLGVTPAHPLISEPYLNTTSEKSCYWNDRICSENSFIIALNWSGNAQPNNHGLDDRSLPLEAFRPLASNKSVTFLSMQKGLGSEQFLTCSFRDQFVSCQQEVDDTWCFLDSAAILMKCSLIITSDTSVAHLAAGLGRPTWLLLHTNSEWRWGLEGESTFWYPSMRLFRQHERGNWDEVMNRVALELEKFLSEQNSPISQEVYQ